MLRFLHITACVWEPFLGIGQNLVCNNAKYRNVIPSTLSNVKIIIQWIATDPNPSLPDCKSGYEIVAMQKRA